VRVFFVACSNALSVFGRLKGLFSLMRVTALVLAVSSIQMLAAQEARADPGFVLGPPSPWAVSLEGYAGLLLQGTSGEDRSHALGGGQLRLRFHYLQAGAFIDTTDSGEARGMRETTQEHFRTLGGFAGAWLPFTHWLDLDASVGLGSRFYRNPITLYGAHGLRETTTAMTLRLGASDRSSQHVFGVRAGAALVGSIDLDPRDVVFHRKYLLADGTLAETTGTTPIGGVTIGVLVTAGFELCPCARARR
jgi:hypothetical protein